MGIRCTSTANVIFEDCEIPADNLIGEKGQGFKIAMQILDAGRIPIAAQAVGIAADAYQRALDYVMRKDSFTQFEQETLAEMDVAVETARLLTYRAAAMKDEGKNIGKMAAMAKLYASEVATTVSHKAIQLMGPDGISSDNGVERNYRDARITEIYEGTSEIQKLVIAGHIKKQYQMNK